MIEPTPKRRLPNIGRAFVPTLLGTLAVALLAMPIARAQGVRSLGMGGLSTPASNEAGNPAFAALSDGAPFSLPLPMGAVNGLLRDDLDPRSERFDLLALFDQATHLGTLLLDPAASPDEIIVEISDVDGAPKVSIDLVGGSPLQLSSGSPAAFGQALDLPLRFAVGPIGLGVRPYVDTDIQLTPLAGFEDLFDQGIASGAVTGRLRGEAGVGVSVSYATALPLPARDAFAGRVYLGVRAEPFIGLARVDGTGTLTVTTTVNDSGENEFGYAYEGDGFFAVIGQGGIGYGATGDLGVAVALPLTEGILTAGLGATDLGVGVWHGLEFRAAGDSLGSSSQTQPTPASRAYLLERFGLNANLAFEFDTGLFGVLNLGSLLIATDGAYDNGVFSGHLGAEGSFGFGPARLLLRAGGGFDAGPVAGIGVGVQTFGVGIDVAVHTYRSPFTTHQAVGAAVGLGFGF